MTLGPTPNRELRIEKVFTEKRNDIPGNILKINFNDGSGYSISFLDNEYPEETARRLCSTAAQILGRI